MFSVPRRGLLAGIAATALAFLLAGSVFGQNPRVTTGLEAPRGLAPDGNHVLVAEQGTGRILRISPFGTIAVAAEGLPTGTAETPEGEQTVGPSAVADAGGTYYVAIGEAPGNEGFDSVYSVDRTGNVQLIADILVLEQENNYDEDVDETGELELNVNLYDLIHDGEGGLFVTGAGANTVFHISLDDNSVTPFAIFENRENPLFPNVGGPTMDQVPTGITMGPDGAVYVSTLTGFPFPEGGALVYRLEDLNGDGDAMDADETTVYADGLTTATDLVFDHDGSLLVTEFSTNMLEQAPGRIVRVANGGIEEVAAPLASPTSLTVLDNGTIMVSMEFLGMVAEANAAAAIVAEGPGGEEPSDGDEPDDGEEPDDGDDRDEDPGITPPSTGDGGLLEQSTGSWMMLSGLVMAAGGMAAGLAVNRKRG